MGRPPLNMQVITVRLSPETLAKIDGLVGNNRRPQFIRDAIENALRIADQIKKSERPER